MTEQTSAIERDQDLATLNKLMMHLVSFIRNLRVHFALRGPAALLRFTMLTMRTMQEPTMQEPFPNRSGRDIIAPQAD